MVRGKNLSWGGQCDYSHESASLYKRVRSVAPRARVGDGLDSSIKNAEGTVMSHLARAQEMVCIRDGLGSPK